MTAISSIIVSVLLFFFMPSLVYSKIYKGVQVEGIELGGYSKEDAYQILLEWKKQHLYKRVMLSFGEDKYSITTTDFDFDLNIDDAVETAWSYGRKGSLWERIKKIRIAETNNYIVPVTAQYDEVKLQGLITQWKNKIDRPPYNATFNIKTGAILVEQRGYRLETDKLFLEIVEAFLKPEVTTVSSPVIIIQPEITANEISSMGIREIISSYTTVFNSQDLNRVANIKLAAMKVNGYIVYPGKSFSFNDIVGPRDKSYGFKEAIEIVNGEFVPGVGGGICQLSSTLYNAVILANLDIVERYNHSKTLTYVPLGRDATVSFDSLDFKFINNAAGPVMIAAQINDNQLIVAILGQHTLTEKVEIIGMDEEKIPPVIIKQPDDSLYLGETRIEKIGKPGIGLTVIRVVRLQGKVVKREILSKDRYLGEDTLIKVGTKVP